MIFFIILLSLFLAPKVFATPQVSIINYPSSVFVGDTFPITFSVFSTDIGTTYHYKIVGDTATDISIFPSCASKYDDCLNLTILNSTNNIATASAKINILSNFNHLKIKIAKSDTHTTTDSSYINIISLLPISTPTSEIIPTPTIFSNPLILSEIMANSDVGQSEWVEIYNPSDQNISLKNLCFYDDTFKNPHCINDDIFINTLSYYVYFFSSRFLNNDGDTLTFINNNVTYPKSDKNFTYSLQPDDSWCFASSSQNLKNNLCSITNITSDSEDKYPLPQLNLIFSPESVVAGEDFNLVFSLKSADPYSLRLIFPFGSQYFPFSNFKDGYSWLTIPLSVSKKLPPGEYPLSYHLKKADSSHLYNYQMGKLNVKAATPTLKVSKSKVLGVSNLSCPRCLDNSASLNYYPASSLKEVGPDANIFSWSFLFAGSILFLSPLLFPKLYSA